MKLELFFEHGEIKKEVPWERSLFQTLFRELNQKTCEWSEYQWVTDKLGIRSIKSVSLLFCGDERMRTYQKEFRNLDRTTDVLSFPTIEWDLLDSEKNGHLGELIVSWPAIVRGAKRGRRTAERELLNVLIHGYLHLLGFDHVKGGRAAVHMRKQQAFLFRSLLPFIKSK